MSIFICNRCHKEYTKNTRKPLSLPCGHVYCQHCILNIYNYQEKTLRCPSDNILHSISFDKIPKCAQIYSNLPRRESPPVEPPHISSNRSLSKEILCMRHNHKKIKFFCKTHNMFLCTICVIDHTEHNLIKVNINKSTFENEIKTLSNRIDECKSSFIFKKEKIEKNEMKVNEYYKTQINEVEKYFKKIIDVLLHRKNELIRYYNAILNEQNKIFAKLKNKIMTITDLFIDINNKESSFLNDLLPNGQYEKFCGIRAYIDMELNKINDIDDNKIKMIKFVSGNVNNDILGKVVDVNDNKIIQLNHYETNKGNNNYIYNNYYKDKYNNSHKKQLCFDGMEELQGHLNNSFETTSSLSQGNNASMINVFKNNLLSKKDTRIHTSNKHTDNTNTHYTNNNNHICYSNNNKQSTNITHCKTECNTNSKHKSQSNRDTCLNKARNSNSNKFISPTKNIYPTMGSNKKQHTTTHSPEITMSTPSTGFMSNDSSYGVVNHYGKESIKNGGGYNNRCIIKDDKKKNWLFVKGNGDGCNSNNNVLMYKQGEFNRKGNNDVRYSVNNVYKNNSNKKINSSLKKELQINDDSF